jgi:F-type H+-transporting ATPase subunit b
MNRFSSKSLRPSATLLLATLLLAPAILVSGARAQNQTVVQQKPPADPKSPSLHQQEEDEDAAYRHSPVVIKLGGMLGMNPEQAATAFTLFNFLVLAAAVGYLLIKNLPKAFRARNSTIQKDLVDARTATEEASARLNSVESRLSKLDEQIAAMRAQAEADSVRDEQRIKASVEDEKHKIIAAAEAEILSATALARRELQSYAAELAIDQAARKLVVTAETDRLLVESFAHRLGADLDKGGAN